MLKEGTDVVIFATGITVGMALKVAEKSTLSVKVVNVSTIKPLNDDKIIELSKDVRAVVCAEEHSIIGGLGSAVAEALRRTNKPIEFVGIKDTFGCSAKNYEELLKHFKITPEEILKTVEEFK